MFDIQKYIENGTVIQTKIAMDINYSKIGSEDLPAVLNDPVVKASFFGDGYKKKFSREQWTEKYLNQLSCAAVAECFNPEYLYYLNEVAEYVRGKKGKTNSKLLMGAIVIAMAVVALVLVVSSLNP